MFSYQKKIASLSVKDVKHASFHNCGAKSPQLWTVGIAVVNRTDRNCETQ